MKTRLRMVGSETVQRATLPEAFPAPRASERDPSWPEAWASFSPFAVSGVFGVGLTTRNPGGPNRTLFLSPDEAVQLAEDLSSHARKARRRNEAVQALGEEDRWDGEGGGNVSANSSH
jgi:hypothetical protein